jgi:bifunctional ADP-heptose synthase (sugar kinase/adenylyltransferase)
LEIRPTTEGSAMSSAVLSTAALEAILATIPRLRVGVLGDLYLDRYLDVDATLTEPSIETGLDAYQVVRVRPSPGAAGTVINNLVALGVARVVPVSVIGHDGEGRELMQALEALGRVELAGVVERSDRRTPTYTKPMLLAPGQPARELNRLDIHNRAPTPDEVQDRIVEFLDRCWGELDALVVLDQVSLPDCGVVTARVRDRLANLADGQMILADSRARIGLFRNVSLKPNALECRRATGIEDVREAVGELTRRANATVFCTRGEAGILVQGPHFVEEVPGYPVNGPVDPVGAGDSTSAGIICALAGGAAPWQAAAFGCLVASVTVAKLGTTGTATPDEVRARWAQVS